MFNEDAIIQAIINRLPTPMVVQHVVRQVEAGLTWDDVESHGERILDDIDNDDNIPDDQKAEAKRYSRRVMIAAKATTGCN